MLCYISIHVSVTTISTSITKFDLIWDMLKTHPVLVPEAVLLFLVVDISDEVADCDDVCHGQL